MIQLKYIKRWHLWKQIGSERPLMSGPGRQRGNKKLAITMVQEEMMELTPAGQGERLIPMCVVGSWEWGNKRRGETCIPPEPGETGHAGDCCRTPLNLVARVSGCVRPQDPALRMGKAQSQDRLSGTTGRWGP